jgi:hypothetical protein
MDAWPTGHAVIADDIVTITLAGLTRTLPATDLDADRSAVQHHIAAWSRHFTREITVTVTDQDGSWTIAIDPDGATHPRPRRKRR